MASIILLIVSFIIFADAGYVWVDDEDEAPAPPGYKRMYVPPLPPLPPLPGFGYLPPLPQPPPLYAPDLSQGFHHFPSAFAAINIPSAAEIKSIKPAPGQIFNGVSLRSVSGFGKNKDGKTVKTGGTTIVVNDNGDVQEAKVGKNPPNIEDDFPSIPIPAKTKPRVFKPVTFKPFVFKPITFKPIDLNYKPAEGENFVAVSHSTHSESSNINGVVSNSGGSNSMVNVNGETDQEAVEFKNEDDPENKQAKENKTRK